MIATSARSNIYYKRQKIIQCNKNFTKTFPKIKLFPRLLLWHVRHRVNEPSSCSFLLLVLFNEYVKCFRRLSQRVQFTEQSVRVRRQYCAALEPSQQRWNTLMKDDECLNVECDSTLSVHLQHPWKLWVLFRDHLMTLSLVESATGSSEFPSFQYFARGRLRCQV